MGPRWSGLKLVKTRARRGPAMRTVLVLESKVGSDMPNCRETEHSVRTEKEQLQNCTPYYISSFAL